VIELSHDNTEDGFHEIQLSGKQLVFLFMATTVVSVVIFLCGVLVGRGVKGDTVSAAETAAASSPGTLAPVAQNAPPVAEPPSTAPPAGSDPLEYPDRLGRDNPAKEKLNPVAESKPVPEPTKPAATQSVVPPPPPAAPPAAAVQAPRTGTWAVQVVALSDRSAANAVVQRLNGKGYPAFLVTPQPGAPVQNYKVQVGRYSERTEAEQMKLRLKKEEQFEPFVLR
jgi:cell division septation protein DedD